MTKPTASTGNLFQRTVLQDRPDGGNGGAGPAVVEETSPQLENGYTRIANEVMEALAKFPIPIDVIRVLYVILRHTYGWRKKEAQIKIAQFMLATGMGERQVYRALQTGVAMNLIIRLTDSARGKGVTYRFQKDYSKWIPLAKTVTLTGSTRGNMTDLTREKRRKAKPAKGQRERKETSLKKRDYAEETSALSSSPKSKNRDEKKCQELRGAEELTDKNPRNRKGAKKNGLSQEDYKPVESHYLDVYQRDFGVKGIIDYKRDRAILRPLIRNYGSDYVCEMIDQLLSLVKGPDKYYNEFSIPKLRQHKDCLVQQIARKRELDQGVDMFGQPLKIFSQGKGV